MTAFGDAFREVRFRVPETFFRRLGTFVAVLAANFFFALADLLFKMVVTVLITIGTAAATTAAVIPIVVFADIFLAMHEHASIGA